MIDDPRLLLLHRTLAARPAARAIRRPGTREAAVALVLRPRDELEILLIKRAERAGDPWSGHMALPGGRREPADDTLAATAIRETAEETGVRLERDGMLLGALDEVEPGSRLLPPIMIAPFVAGVPPATTAAPDEREVEAAIWVPLQALREPGALSDLVLELEAGTRTFPAIRYGEHVIWGLTYRILSQFLEVAAGCGL